VGAMPHISAEQLLLVKRLVLRYHELWDTSPKAPPPSATECAIRLKVDATFNGQSRYQSYNPATRGALRTIIEEKLKRDIIEPSTSACSSSVLLVPKPGGGVRFCVDYRALNRAIEPDAYTLPSVTENLAELSGDRFFTCLDLKEAFWTVPLTPDSRELTAFRTPDGLFHYKRIPMGLKTASAVFCRFIDKVLGPMKWDHVLTYIDDILVHTPTFEQHLDVLTRLFGRLSAANLTLGAKKCFLCRPEVRFLGHVVDAEGVKPDPAKITAIEALQLPNSAKELEVALGILGYYRRFILNYSKVAAPLRAKKAALPSSWRKRPDGKVPWTEAERSAFFKLRDALKHEPVLQHPNWDHPFELHTDASHNGLGAVLCQRVDGRQHVIAYASRSLSKLETPYSIWELEALAMIWATRLFRMYLTNTRFKIYTDSRAARSLLEANDAAAGGRLLRWRLALTEFDFDVIHRAGAQSGNADALSRMPLPSSTPYDEGPTEVAPSTLLHLVHDLHERREHTAAATGTLGLHAAYFPPREGEPARDADAEARTAAEWAQLQRDDREVQAISLLLKRGDERTGRRFRVDKATGLLYKTILDPRTRGPPRYVLVVPAALRAFVLTRFHSLPVSGHKGRDKTRLAIAREYHWPYMHKDIAAWVKACPTCMRRKTPRPLHSDVPASVSEATRPWQAIAIDLVTAGASNETIAPAKYILTII